MKKLATFAMGCFWYPDFFFSKIKGVLSTRVGYTGCMSGVTNPTYEEVCSAETGCAEAIEITFDSTKISYDDLLDMFWTHHDPTTMNRQGPDEGPQYRSAVFYHNDEQKKQALASLKKWQAKLKDKKAKIVTEIAQASTFYAAEDYHQKYVDKTGRACHVPKNVFK